MAAQFFFDVIYSLANCLVCFPSSPQLKINSRSFKMLRLLGEGGFSYVYLVQDSSTSELYALKKIRCPFGAESVAQALKEVEAYTLFSTVPNIIHSIDHSVQNDGGSKISGVGDIGGGGSKTVYILLPYYRRGNLQDAINANLVNHTRFPERRLMQLMAGVAVALKGMHQYKVPRESGGRAAGAKGKAKAVREEAASADRDAARRAGKTQREKKMEMRAEPPDPKDGGGGDDDEEEDMPLMEGEVTRAQEGVAEGERRAYAHRDIKPGNIMISDDGHAPVLMDLGSLSPSPTSITSRSLALAVQDTAAEHSTMPYRAPELFDVKTGSVVDSKVDIWSLGCTLYACLVGKSPFEARSEETGGSLSICVLSGDWRFPDEDTSGNKARPKQVATNGGTPNRNVSSSSSTTAAASAAAAAASDGAISTSVRDIVRACLQVEPAERPDIDELIDMLESCIQGLPESPPSAQDDAGDGAHPSSSTVIR